MTDENRPSPAWEPVFLEKLTETGIIIRSAEHAGISQGTVNARRKRHPHFAEACRQALSLHGGSRRGRPGVTRTLPKWCGPFLEALAETSNVAASAERAKVAKHRVYRLRRTDPDFARQWFAALAEGYDNLEMELLQHLRSGESPGTGKDKARFDTATALRCLSAHRENVGREKGRRRLAEEVITIAAINAKIDALRTNKTKSDAAVRKARKAAARKSGRQGTAKDRSEGTDNAA